MLVKAVKQMLQKHKMVQPGQSLTVALSGGIDSVCLLHVLCQLQPEMQYKLQAVHVHHGLRAEADEDESFCRQLCNRWQIPLTVCRVDVPQRVEQSGESIEEAARNLRYGAFQTLQTDRIALAHHQQDQAETLLLHLLRGSGLTGLCAMRPVRLPYVRPFLEISRGQIEAYAAQQKLPHAEDASNQDTAFRRNRIRHELLPLLAREYQPEIVKILAQTAGRLQEEEDYLEARPPCAEGPELSIQWLQGYPVNLQKRILRGWLADQGYDRDIAQVHVDQLLDLVQGQSGRRISLPKGLTVAKSYDILHICSSAACLQEKMQFPSFEMELLSLAEAMKQWNSHEQIPALPEEKWLDADALTQMPVWRTRRSGDYIMAAGGRKKLKEFMIDAKIPREQRERIPLLADGSHILWIYGYRISDGARLNDQTQRVLHVRRI